MQSVEHSRPDDTAHAARIGPNAIIRMAEALRSDAGSAETERLFGAAGLAHYLAEPPQEMVDEREVIALHRLVRSALGHERAARISREAGRLTGDYLLANRIPGPAQIVLRLLPRALATRALLTAIGRNAWTFVGSGAFRAETRPVARITIANCPICRDAHAGAPLCDYYAGTFERLFRALVNPQARVTETACSAVGADACAFEIR
jgi:divinyl protochlorophyllide a 8-vinyl-reductase